MLFRDFCVSRGRQGWEVQRLQPCPGPPRKLLAIGRLPPEEWPSDRWEHYRRTRAASFLIVACTDTADRLQAEDLVRPLSHAERGEVIRRSRAARPGPSGFKMAFLPLFPDWLQETLWLSLDVQRACGLRAQHSNSALQINIP